jgi:hypothetical protein
MHFFCSSPVGLALQPAIALAAVAAALICDPEDSELPLTLSGSIEWAVHASYLQVTMFMTPYLCAGCTIFGM